MLICVQSFSYLVNKLEIRWLYLSPIKNLVKCGLKKGTVKSARGNCLHLFFNDAKLHSNHGGVFTRYIAECHKNRNYLGKLGHDYMKTIN